MKATTRKINPFSKYKNDKEYRALYREAREQIDLSIQLYELRKKRRLTQAELARKVKMTQGEIARLESGEHNVTVATLVRVAGALNGRLKIA